MLMGAAIIWEVLIIVTPRQDAWFVITDFIPPVIVRAMQ